MVIREVVPGESFVVGGVVWAKARPVLRKRAMIAMRMVTPLERKAGLGFFSSMSRVPHPPDGCFG